MDDLIIELFRINNDARKSLHELLAMPEREIKIQSMHFNDDGYFDRVVYLGKVYE